MYHWCLSRATPMFTLIALCGIFSSIMHKGMCAFAQECVCTCVYVCVVQIAQLFFMVGSLKPNQVLISIIHLCISLSIASLFCSSHGPVYSSYVPVYSSHLPIAVTCLYIAATCLQQPPVYNSHLSSVLASSQK